MSDHSVEIMFIVFGGDKISLHKNNSHNLHRVITHLFVLAILITEIVFSLNHTYVYCFVEKSHNLVTFHNCISLYLYVTVLHIHRHNDDRKWQVCTTVMVTDG